MSALFKRKRKPRRLCSWCENHGAEIEQTITVDTEAIPVVVHGACQGEMRDWLAFRAAPSIKGVR